jgi:Tfp pilus assembly protein PilO
MTSRILPFLSILASIGIFFAYVNPLWTGPIADSKAAIAENDRALKAAADYVKRQNELAAQRSAIDPVALARLETFLPDSVNNVGVILDINALAERSGIALSSIDVAEGSGQGQGEVAQSPIGTIDMVLTAKGTYDALQSFLAGVESSARLLDERELTVSGSATGVYEYQMIIRLYWLR